MPVPESQLTGTCLRRRGAIEGDDPHTGVELFGHAPFTVGELGITTAFEVVFLTLVVRTFAKLGWVARQLA